MIQDRVLRGMASSTRRAYLQAGTKFARHYNQSPDQISNQEIKAYLLYLHLEEKRATSTCNVAAVALRFLYHKTLGRPQTDFDVPIARQPSKLPFVLSRDEVARLRPTDIDSSRMLIHVEQGKGAKDRGTAPSVRHLLRPTGSRPGTGPLGPTCQSA